MPLIEPPSEQLTLSFSGRILDHLGIQMYQSPVAAIAELVSNAWDADATQVDVSYSDDVTDPSSKIIIKDNGSGMTFEECQKRYLNVGYCRRGKKTTDTTPKGRAVLGRKGIGKFAGFGISKRIEIETISEENGERIVFALDLETIRGADDEYVTSNKPVELLTHDAPDENRKQHHGTTVTLSSLVLRRGFGVGLEKSLSRRFMLKTVTHPFAVLINGTTIPGVDDGVQDVEFSFPKDYSAEELPEGVTIEGEWAKETLAGGHEISWKIDFFKETIKTGDQGIAIFSHGKMAQVPCFFDLQGGLPSQQGQVYMFGRVLADYVDELEEDVISPERQRINWETDAGSALKEWGQKKVKELLRLWKEKRAAKRFEEIKSGRLSADISRRMAALSRTERKAAEKAFMKLAEIPTISDSHYEDMISSLLTAWEQGRLKELMDELAENEDMDAGELVSILAEAEVLSGLNIAEAIRTRLEVIETLKKMVEERGLENDIRDYVAKHPWIVSPEFETYIVESSLKTMLDAAADETSKKIKITDDLEWKDKRVDLVLRAGPDVVVMEFMRPGIPLDADHVNRFSYYVSAIRDKVAANTELAQRFGGAPVVRGMLIADSLSKDPALNRILDEMQNNGKRAMDWGMLLGLAAKEYKDYLEILSHRSDDQRFTRLKQMFT